MAQSKKWRTEDLRTALQDLQTNKKSIRVVAAAYGIPKSFLHEQIEKMMKPETMELYQKRLEEGYDLENDELYVIWSQLKKMSIANQSAKKSDLSTQKAENYIYSI